MTGVLITSLLFMMTSHISSDSTSVKKALKLSQKAVEMQKNKNYDEALKFYKKSAELNPGLASTHYALGYLYAQKRDYEKAM